MITKKLASNTLRGVARFFPAHGIVPGPFSSAHLRRLLLQLSGPPLPGWSGSGLQGQFAAAPTGIRSGPTMDPSSPGCKWRRSGCSASSQFAFRFPQYLAAHLALAGLCSYLILKGSIVPAVLLPVAWLGDRSLTEVCWGRMEGIALLFLGGGFVSLAELLGRRGGQDRRAGLRLGAACGWCLGMAAGFNPAAVSFGILVFVVLAVIPGACCRWWSLAGLLAGVSVPIGLVYLSWSADFRGAVEQFRWVSRTLVSGYDLVQVHPFARLPVLVVLSVLFPLPVPGHAGPGRLVDPPDEIEDDPGHGCSARRSDLVGGRPLLRRRPLVHPVFDGTTLLSRPFHHLARDWPVGLPRSRGAPVTFRRESAGSC